MPPGNPRHTYVRENLRETSVKVRISTEYLWERRSYAHPLKIPLIRDGEFHIVFRHQVPNLETFRDLPKTFEKK